MFPSDPTAPIDLARVMGVDRHRLQKTLQRLQRQARANRQSPEFNTWLTQVQASIDLRERRAVSVPQLTYDPQLPISAHRSELIELIRTRQTIVVCGETGSGKSTQLPKFCLDAGLGLGGLIGHTQPRRLAARAIASRLSEELGTDRGAERNLVAFKIRFSDSTKPGTLIKLMTDGVLLAETQSDRYLDQYEAIIIDEAHQRSLNIDFLLGYLRSISGQRPDLKLIITSATIDPERFAEHFADESGPAPIVEVSGRTYPVEQRYRPLPTTAESNGLDEQACLSGIAAAIDELIQEGPGDILVFLPTERDIRLAAKHLRGHFTRLGGAGQLEILPLYARLSHAEQNRIFESHPRRRIVLSTNVAESSLTVPGIHFVIDTGLVRISRYAPRSKVKRLPIEEVAQASANQRSGRCGRLGPGICIRLFSEDDYRQRPKYTTPEIRRSDLTSVMLQSLVLRLGPLEEFPLLDPPSAESIRDAQRTLRELGAVDERRGLTPIGRQLGLLPCEPRVGRMLLEAAQRSCLAEVLVIAAGLECQEVRQRPAGLQPQADAAHAQFLDPHSDFLSLLRLWDFFEHLRGNLSRSRLEKALIQNFLSPPGFREWAETVRQLKDILAGAGMRVGKRKFTLPAVAAVVTRPQERRAGRSGRDDSDDTSKIPRPEGYAAIHQSLLAGLLSGIAQRGERHEYKGMAGMSLAVWPGSGLFRRQPKWIMAAEIVETSKRYARTLAELDVEWIEMAGQSLLKYSYSDPHWSSKSGSAMVYRKSTLYGLTLASGRRVAYAALDATAARSMMIEHGLVAGDWHCNESFYRHNQELVADIDELARRTRSREFIIDRFHLANFYEARVPSDVVDLNSLRSWLRRHANTPQAQALHMQPADLIAENEQVQHFEDSFPNTLRIGESQLPLAYHFEPGHAVDGVSLTVPQAALRQISDEALGWLVPGLLEEKVLALIKAMPKGLRTNFVPAPDVAKQLVKELAATPRSEPFTAALSRAMSVYAGERVSPQDLAVAGLPDHLRFLIKVVDDEGHELARGRDVSQLIAQFAQRENAVTPGRSGSAPAADACPSWTDRPVTPTTFAGVPGPVSLQRGGVLVAAFPAVVDLRQLGQGEGAEMRLVDDRLEAERITQRGITRLFAMQHNRSLRNHVAHLPQFPECSLQLSHLMNNNDLKRRLQDLIARIALVEGQSLVSTREEFEARNARAVQEISMAAQEVASWLPGLATGAMRLRLQLEQAPSLWAEVSSQINAQLNSLFAGDFLAYTPWSWLKEFPRYLSAASMRLEKLKHAGLAKDSKLSEPIVELERAHQKLAGGVQAGRPEFVAGLQAVRWMLEELRVSIFAQQLGTKQPVSYKRIRDMLGALE